MIGNRIARVEDIIWRQIGDEIVVIKDDGLSLHVLNTTAAHIWEMCNGDCGPDEIASSLCERFDVSLGEANVDVKDIIEKLEQLGLLRRVEEVTG
ncbi:PqqD family protein [Chloroflexota bacterium]